MQVTFHLPLKRRGLSRSHLTLVDKPPTIARASAKKQVGARIDAKDADFLESLPGGTTYQVYLAVTEYVNRLRAAVR